MENSEGETMLAVMFSEMGTGEHVVLGGAIIVALFIASMGIRRMHRDHPEWFKWL